MTDPDPLFQLAGAAIRGLGLGPPTSVDALRLQVRKRRHRRRAVTVGAVTATLAIVAVVFAVILDPGPQRVITTGPGPTQATPPGRPVYLPTVAHAKTWTDLDIGRLRLFVPPTG
jgi:hypothetical protein